MVSRFPAALEGGDLTPPLAHKKGRRISSSRITPSDTSRRPSGDLQDTFRTTPGDHFRTTPGDLQETFRRPLQEHSRTSPLPAASSLRVHNGSEHRAPGDRLAGQLAGSQQRNQYVVDFCKAKVDGMFADPGNSNAFYHCSNHYTFYKLCQQGLVFNQRLGACVWPSQGV
ncbi:unnamed protein product [Lampetra planeri]